MARSQADRVFHGLCRPGTQSGPVVFFTARSRRVGRGTRVPRQLQKSISVQKSGRNLHRFRSGVFLQNSALAIRQLIPLPCTVTTSPRLWAGKQPHALPRHLSCPPESPPAQPLVVGGATMAKPRQNMAGLSLGTKPPIGSDCRRNGINPSGLLRAKIRKTPANPAPRRSDFAKISYPSDSCALQTADQTLV